jgi:hypothetical protein
LEQVVMRTPVVTGECEFATTAVLSDQVNLTLEFIHAPHPT